MRTLFIITLVFFCVTPLPGSDVLITNANIMTVANGTVRNGSILVQDGKITGLGTDISAPPGVEVVDVSGNWITPGIIDCHAHIALDSVNEGTLSVTSMTGTEDVIDPTSFNIYRGLAGGVTTTNLLHGSANPIGGKNVVIKLRWGKTADEMIFRGAMPGIKFALGENPKRPGIRTQGSTVPRRYPGTRMGVEDVIRTAFDRAREYQKERSQYQQEKARGSQPLLPPRRDLQLEALVEVLERKRLVHAHSYRADEILMLIRVADDYGFTIGTFQHVLEGYKVADEIAAHGAGASTFSDWWAYKVEAYDAIPYNAAIMTRRGVLVSLNSDSGEEARHLNQEAAKAMRYGDLSADEALALVTLNPARQLRIDDRVGSIEVGKDADLVVFNNYPLSVYAFPDQVYIDGELYFSREMDARRQQQLVEEKARLRQLESGETGAPEERKPQVDVVDDVEVRGLR